MGGPCAIDTIHRSKANAGSIQMQQICYDALVRSCFPDNLQITLEKRLNNAFSPFSVDCKNVVSLSQCFCTLKGCKVSVAIRVFKCWINGWATSRRYGNNEGKILPCLFGCTDCVDSLDHYLQCPHLFALWSFLIEGSPEDPLIRWGLIYPSKPQFKIFA